jgi:hypothetical protein
MMQRVVAVPEVAVLKRQHGADDYLLLACDGLWDVMESVEAVAVISTKLAIMLKEMPTTREGAGAVKEPADAVRAVCNQLLEDALRLESRDNVSVLLVLPPRYARTVTAHESESDLQQAVSSSVAKHAVAQAVASLMARQATSRYMAGAIGGAGRGAGSFRGGRGGVGGGRIGPGRVGDSAGAGGGGRGRAGQAEPVLGFPKGPVGKEVKLAFPGFE